MNVNYITKPTTIYLTQVYIPLLLLHNPYLVSTEIKPFHYHFTLPDYQPSI